MSTTYICRICAENSEELISIFGHSGLELNLKSKIETHLNLKVDIADRLPHQMCQSCTFKLNVCHELFQTAKAADLKLRHLFENPSEEISLVVDGKSSCMVSGERFQSLGDSLCDNQGYPTTDRTTSSEKSANIQYEVSVGDNSEESKNIDKEQQVEHVINDTVIVSNGNTFTLLEQASSQPQIDSNSIIGIKKENLLSSDQFMVAENENNNNDGDNVNKVTILESEHQKMLTNKSLDEENCGESESEPSKSKYGQDLSSLSCPQCGKICQSAKGLDVHISTHSDVSPYLCDLCGKKFKHVNNLRCHKRTHREESLKKTHMCNLCNKGFRSKFHLSEHMNTHNDVRPYKCLHCSKTFHKSIHLRQHASSHISEKDKSVCETCGSRFTRRSNLMQHIRKCHAENRTYKCRICFDEFPTLSLLLSHRSTHTQENIKQNHVTPHNSYPCHICGKVFLKKRSYELHSQSHSGENKCWCDMCGKVLSSKASLSYHKKSFHCSERTWHCQYCGKGYMSNQLQLIHERTHTGIKPYICSVCKKSFSGANSLNQHMKKHLDLRNFECTYCLKRFLRKATLTVHLRTHTGEKPFICDICGNRFTQKNDMLKHQRTHDSNKYKRLKTEFKTDSTRVEELTCELCNSLFNSKDELEKHKVSHNVTVPVVFTVSNNDVLSTITEIITDECQTVITLSNVQPYDVLKTNR